MAFASLLSSPLFLSFASSLSLSVPVTDLDHARILNSHKTGVLLAIPNSVCVGPAGVGVYSVMVLIGRAIATQVSSGVRKVSYRRT